MQNIVLRGVANNNNNNNKKLALTGCLVSANQSLLRTLHV